MASSTSWRLTMRISNGLPCCSITWRKALAAARWPPPASKKMKSTGMHDDCHMRQEMRGGKRLGFRDFLHHCHRNVPLGALQLVYAVRPQNRKKKARIPEL